MKDYKYICTVLGLSEEEQHVYAVLLQQPASSIRKLADAAGLNRGVLYEHLKSLQTIGLVSKKTRGKREHYTAESPEVLQTLLQEKRKEVWHAQELAKEVVPALLTQTPVLHDSPLVRYYEDDDGVVAILKDVIRTCERLQVPEYIAYSSLPLRQYLYRKFPDFTAKRIQAGIEVKVLAIGEGGDITEKSARKWLGSSKDGSSSYIIVYGDKVAHIGLLRGYIPYGVVVEDRGVADMQRTLFHELWNRL